MTQENIGNLVEFSTCQQKPTCQCRRHRRCRFHPWVGKIPWSRKWQPTPVLLPGESHGQRNLAGYSPWGCKESNLTEHALKGPSLSLAVSSVFLARVSCPSPWHSRTTWDISISLKTTQTFDICGATSLTSQAHPLVQSPTPETSFSDSQLGKHTLLSGELHKVAYICQLW